MKREDQEMRGGVERAKHYFPFVYYQKLKELRAKADKGERKFETQIHKARDGFAFLELASALAYENFRFGGVFFNPPAQVQSHLQERERRERRKHRRILRQARFHLGEQDLLLLATRPPLHDTGSGVKRQIEESGLPLEKHVFPKLEAIFTTCDRSQVVVSDTWIPFGADARAEEYRAVNFHQTQGARVQYLNAIQHQRKPTEPQLTVGYLLTIPPDHDLQFRITAAFGIGGTETLWFCHLLRILATKENGEPCWPQNLFHRALHDPDQRLWTVPFLVPDYAPTLLKCDLNTLIPKKEHRGVIEWRQRK